MATQVEICNLALGNVGVAKSISALTESTKEAFQCKRVYDVSLRAVLRAQWWRFATGYYTLNNLGDPPSGWDYRYAYPTDCIVARYIVKDSEASDAIPFDIAAGDSTSTRVVLTDRESAVLCYTRYMDDPVTYPADFVLALSWHIATHIAMPMTGDVDMQKSALSTYTAMLSTAAAKDANEGYKRYRRTPGWIAARA